MCVEFVLLEVKVRIVFLGTVGFSLRRDRRYYLGNKCKRVASELLHGKLEPVHGEDDNDNNPFMYQFGKQNYTDPQMLLRKDKDGDHEPYMVEFQRLTNVEHIYSRLPKHIKKQGEKDFWNLGRPTNPELKAKKLRAARESRKLQKGLKGSLVIRRCMWRGTYGRRIGLLVSCLVWEMIRGRFLSLPIIWKEDGVIGDES
jgi:hypothetical protein